MSLTIEQKVTAVYKKDRGVADTETSRKFFEEPVGGRISYNSKMWLEDTSIPSAAPTGLSDGEISGVVQRKINLGLTAVTGAPDSFYHEDLKDAIPFNWGDGSYNYVIKDSLGSILPSGYNDVEVDNVAGILRFYGGAPVNVPPTITFFRYAGTKGVSKQIHSVGSWDGSLKKVTFADESKETWVISDGTTALAIGLEANDDSDSVYRNRVIILDNSGNSSAIETITWDTDSGTYTWHWSDGDPSIGIAIGEVIRLEVTNDSDTEVFATTIPIT